MKWVILGVSLMLPGERLDNVNVGQLTESMFKDIKPSYNSQQSCESDLSKVLSVLPPHQMYSTNNIEQRRKTLIVTNHPNSVALDVIICVPIDFSKLPKY